ncbi:VOC family protein, partial [Hydrogenophaga sp.]|uniref:VOC family protein n=1 Tax=Hydrogenophaga sp. TaxID=1904254 RepID=UPI002BC54B04
MTCCEDPAGNQLELFYGQMCPKTPFVSPQGVQFVSGELGLGHVVFKVFPYQETLRFYRELLGFRLTDMWTGKDAAAVFLHCKPGLILGATHLPLESTP